MRAVSKGPYGAIWQMVKPLLLTKVVKYCTLTLTQTLMYKSAYMYVAATICM